MRREFGAGDRFASFVIEGVIGRGGMGVVYRARRETGLSDRVVALKVIRPELATDDRFLARFRDEARRAASLEHPSIVPVYEADEHEGVPFIAMRLIQGRDLHALVQARGPLEPAAIVRIAEQIGSALDTASRQQPGAPGREAAERLIDEHQRAYLTDSARPHARRHERPHRRRQRRGLARVHGAEQLQADRAVDVAPSVRACLHALEAACGAPPFARSRRPARNGAPPRGAALCPRSRSRRRCSTAARRALANEPADR